MKIEDVHKTVVEVEKLLAGVLTELKHLGKSLDSLNDARSENTQLLNDLRRAGEKDIVALKKDIDELRRWCEKNDLAALKLKVEVLEEKISKLDSAISTIGNRAWSVIPNVTSAIVNVLLAALVAFLVARLSK